MGEGITYLAMYPCMCNCIQLERTETYRDRGRATRRDSKRKKDKQNEMMPEKSNCRKHTVQNERTK